MPRSSSPAKKTSRDKSKDRRRPRRSRSRSIESRSSKQHSRRYYKERSRSRTDHRSKYVSSGKHKNYRATSSSYRSVTPDRHRSSKRNSRERKKRRTSSSESTSSTNSEHSSSSVTEVKISKDKFKKSTRIPTPPPPPITQHFTSVDLLDEVATQETIDLINDDEFVPKSFTSSKNINEKVVIDLNKQTITVPTFEAEEVQSTLFHPNLFGDDAVRMEKWVKKLFNYRQKMFLGST